MVRTLLDRGVDPNVRDEGDIAFPIHFAAERGDLRIVTLLDEHGADPIGTDTGHELDVVGWAVCFDDANPCGRTISSRTWRDIHALPAVALGKATAMRELAQSGEDLNRRMDRTNHRRTALHLAVVKKQPASLAALNRLAPT